MANEQNLRPVPITSTEQAKRMGRKGGLSRSPKKQWAARLRGMKKKGLANEEYKQMYAVMTEKESYVLDSYIRLKKWLLECEDNKEKVVIERLIIDVGKLLHGYDKQPINIPINDSNVIINIVDPNRDEKCYKKVHKEEGYKKKWR